MTRLTIPVLATTLALALAGAVVDPPAGAAPAPGVAVRHAAPAVTTHLVVSDGHRYRLRLRPVGIRSPQFEVLVQQPDGSLRPTHVSPTHAYAGSVDGDPAALAVAVRRRDGHLAGQITHDGRATAFFVGSRVVGTGGTDRPALHWPSASDAALNVTVRPGQVPTVTRRWDVGFDLDHSYVAGDLHGSVARAMDAVELTTVELLATYETDARLRPAIGRVVIRADQASSPYAGKVATLDDVRAQWTGALDHDVVDNVAYLHTDGDGGGVAYVGTVGGDYAVSLDGSGADIDIIRHELGHTWGPHDNHTNGPEGQTIMSGNDYARFDGTELAAIFATRDDRLASDPGRFPRVTTSHVGLAPYATLDLRDRLHTGGTVRIRPVANDVDANGDRLHLQHLPGRSHLGARLVRHGDVVTYRAPRVARARTLDWFTYRITDGTGRRATGVVLLRVSPRS